MSTTSPSPSFSKVFIRFWGRGFKRWWRRGWRRRCFSGHLHRCCHTLLSTTKTSTGDTRRKRCIPANIKCWGDCAVVFRITASCEVICTSAIPQNAAAIMYPHASFSYYFHTPRTQKTQLRFQGAKVINDCRTNLQLLKDFRHHMSHRETRRPRPVPGDITVYPCPWPDLGHRSYHMSSGRIGLLLYVALFSVSVLSISVTPQFVCSSHGDSNEDRTINELCGTFILYLDILPTVPSCRCTMSV